jgi:antitoxin (DNA-binding transcriptional repressor) of toxin-antitoxin stability system
VESVSIGDLLNQGGDIVDRASRGAQVTITRAGQAVAELRPLPSPPLSAEALLAQWRRLPDLDPAALRADLDETLDARL